MVLKCVVKNCQHISALPIYIIVPNGVRILAQCIGNILYYGSSDKFVLFTLCLSIPYDLWLCRLLSVISVNRE